MYTIRGGSRAHRNYEANPDVSGPMNREPKRKAPVGRRVFVHGGGSSGPSYEGKSDDSRGPALPRFRGKRSRMGSWRADKEPHNDIASSSAMSSDGNESSEGSELSLFLQHATESWHNSMRRVKNKNKAALEQVDQGEEIQRLVREEYEQHAATLQGKLDVAVATLGTTRDFLAWRETKITDMQGTILDVQEKLAHSNANLHIAESRLEDEQAALSRKNTGIERYKSDIRALEMQSGETRTRMGETEGKLQASRADCRKKSRENRECAIKLDAAVAEMHGYARDARTLTKSEVESKEAIRAYKESDAKLRDYIRLLSPRSSPRVDWLTASHASMKNAINSAVENERRGGASDDSSSTCENLKKRLSKVEEDLGLARHKASEAQDGVLCVVCLTNRRKKALVPCMHLTLCDQCVGCKTCPICRCTVEGSIDVFLS